MPISAPPGRSSRIGPLLISTMNDLPGYEIEEVIGEVYALTVRSRNLGSQLGASLKSTVGASSRG
jgi:uncharacterized protein YbjQ (UPF0145 family)